MLAAAGLALCSAFPEKLDALEDHLDDDEYEEEDKRPYSFSWAASRHYNGAPDREHQEQRGEDGITRGVYRWVAGQGGGTRGAGRGVAGRGWQE